MKKMQVDRWGVPAVWGPLELGVGLLPGRKRMSLYLCDPKEDKYTPLAYFTTPEAADILVTLLDEVEKVVEGKRTIK